MTLHVVNISKEAVALIAHDAPLVSIGDRWGNRTVIPNAEERPLLYLTFSPGDDLRGDDVLYGFTKEQAQKLIAFVEANRAAGTLYIQCGEGRMRSYTLCETLSNWGNDIKRDLKQSSVIDGWYDRHTANILTAELRHGE